MIDRDTWLILAGNLDRVRREQQRLKDEADDTVKLVFDKNDQAHVVPK